MLHSSISGSILLGFSGILVALVLAGSATAQTATYHLHKEASSTSGLNQLKTANPDASTIAVTSANLKNLATGEYVVKAFDTQSGVPNTAGVIPAASTVTFTLWMSKTANVGTMFPRAKLNLNNAAGAALCSSTGSTALTTTLTKYTLSCTTATNISMAATDRFYLWVGVNLTAVSSSNFQASLNVEGTLNGNYDSQIIAPLPITPPSISSLSATSGTVGTSITVSGSNFGASQGTSTLTFNGVAATPTSWSASSIVAPVPAAATTGPVVVAVKGVPGNGVTFTVKPKINSLSPTSGPVATAITISGTTFGATQGTSMVTFNGTTAIPTSWNATTIVVPVPANATTGSVIVTVAGQASNAVTFTVTSKINSLSPTSGTVGTSITISGSTFGATQGASTVTFNGTAATPTSWSAASIAVPVPAGASTGQVIVTVSGQASNGVTFTVRPKINTLLPSSGAIGDSVTINGSAFGATQRTSTVTFNGTTASPTSWNATSIVTQVPPSTLTGPVVVTVGGQASSGITFTVTPKINNLSPAEGVIGTSITISGTSFGSTQGSSTVTFNGTTAAPTSWSNTSIAVPVPAGAASGLVSVTVNGSASNGVNFTVAARIDGVTPTSGNIGTPVTINGSGFGATQGSSTLTFNGAAATPTSWSNTSIVAPVPAGASTGPVIVSVGSSPSNGITFTVVSTGGISGRITAADGTTPITGATVKAFQGANHAATTTTNSSGDYSITAVQAGTYTITASASGYGMKSKGLVIVAGGATTTADLSLDAIVNGPVSYIYDPLGRLVSTVGPTETVVYSYDAVGNLLSISRQSSNQVAIVQLSPGSGPIGATVTISGTGFSATANQNTVAFNGVAAAITSATTTQIVASVPAGATTGPVTVTSPAGSANSATAFTVTGDQGAPTISSFTPTIGSVTTPVTVSGNNFDTAAANNKVKFNGVNAGAFSATATSIDTSVPAVGSGRISVTTPNGTATSSGDFFVLPTGSAASDFQVMGRINFPGSQTVTITTAGKKAMLLFDGLAGQRFSLDPTNNNIGISTLSIFKPDGTLWTAKQMYTWSANFFETQNFPVTGTYTIILDTNTYYSGSMTLNLYNVPPDVAGPIAFGVATPVTLTTPGQNARLTFSGTAGQKVSLNASGVTIISSSLAFLKPDGSTLTSTGLNTSGNFIDSQTLPVTGTYTVLLDPTGGYSGNATLTLYDSSDLILPITPGGSAVTVTTTIPGQNAKLSFSGAAGQRIALNIPNISFPIYGGYIYLRNSAGTTLAQVQAYSSTTNGFIDTQTLPAADTYYVLVDQNYMGTGSVVLALYDVPSDATGAISIGGSPVNLTTTTPGQNGSLSFTGNSGQKVSLTYTRSMALMNVNTNVTIKKPDGTTLAGPVPMGPNTGLFDQQTLPTTGIYSIFADPYIENTGMMTFTLFDAGDATATITPGGPPVTITTTVPGQNGRITFSGTAGQKVSLALSNVSLNAAVSILNPDGSSLAYLYYLNSYGDFIDTKTLPATGTYTILIDAGYTSTGSVTLTLYDDADITGAVAIGGAPLSLTFTAPGQDAILTFSGTAGQQVTVRITNNVFYNATVRLNAPDGSMLTQGWTSTASLNLPTQTLPVTGTYSITINPAGAAVGHMDVNVTTP